jgi:hypothetical protein
MRTGKYTLAIMMKSETVESQDDWPRKLALLTPFVIGMFNLIYFERIIAVKKNANKIKRYISGTFNILK